MHDSSNSLEACIESAQMALNVEEFPAYLAPFEVSFFVVGCNVLLKRFVLPRACALCARLTRHGVEDDVISVESDRLRAMCIIILFGNVVAPVVATFVLDENCLRYYLLFSPEVRRIMEDWDIAMTGASAYRSGFCLPKIINVYFSIWHMTAALDVFVAPSVKVLTATPQFVGVVEKVRSALHLSQKQEDPAADVEKQSQDSLRTVASILNFICIGVGFGVWTPTLLLLLAMHCPIWLFATSLVDALCAQRDATQSGLFCQHVVELIKVPLSATIPSVAVVALCLCATLAFLDLGFDLAPWVVFWSPVLPYLLFKHQQFAGAATASEFNESTQTVVFARQQRFVVVTGDEAPTPTIHFRRLPEFVNFQR
eukprot:TRINITY_DN4764_c0_g2_i7.p1 TRINITY_DN4764_c0_g2~~TRINITY_DN4764_c0_g2_i7.p1  ORF type:complete len:369 (-),score=85.79 TRINITY_DN4764_c0_g2_i7:16-1122(-)